MANKQYKIVHRLVQFIRSQTPIAHPDHFVQQSDGTPFTGNFWQQELDLYQNIHCVEGKIHREDGPAIISYDSTGTVVRHQYYLHDKQHRLDGPADISYYNDGTVKMVAYAVHGIHMEAVDFYNLKELIKKMGPQILDNLLAADTLVG